MLILDDFGLGGPLREGTRRELLEVLEVLYGRTTTAVTGQFERKAWHEWIADPTIADTVLDRVVHNTYALRLAGPSGHKEKTPKH